MPTKGSACDGTDAKSRGKKRGVLYFVHKIKNITGPFDSEKGKEMSLYGGKCATAKRRKYTLLKWKRKRCELKDEQADICKYLLLFRNRSETIVREEERKPKSKVNYYEQGP